MEAVDLDAVLSKKFLVTLDRITDTQTVRCEIAACERELRLATARWNGRTFELEARLYAWRVRLSELETN